MGCGETIELTAVADVSVLMTVWNGEQYLRAAMESVRVQRVRWELIVVDDGSTDRSVEIVQEMCAEDGRIRLLRHPGGRNCGISASRNLALRHARAATVAFLDCDDVFLPGHLQQQMNVLRTHPEVAMVYSSAERWVDHGAPFDEGAALQGWWGGNYIPPLVPAGAAAGVLQPGTLLRWMLADESVAPCMCTVVMRTATAREIGGFEDQFEGLYDDQVFHGKLASRFPVYAHDVCTARYRQHGASCCATAGKDPVLRAEQAERFRAWVQPLLEPTR